MSIKLKSQIKSYIETFNFWLSLEKIFKKLGKKPKKFKVIFINNVVVYPFSNRDECHCVTVIIFFLQSEARVAWISSHCFESFSPLSIDVTEGVITTRSNRMKFRLSIFFSVNQFASRYFSQPVSADQIWKILSIIPSLTVTILCHWRHF